MIDLPPEQSQALRDHLRSIDARETCPICDADTWLIRLAGELLARVCRRCGHVLLFDPAAIGLTVGWRLTPDGHQTWLVPSRSPS